MKNDLFSQVVFEKYNFDSLRFSVLLNELKCLGDGWCVSLLFVGIPKYLLIWIVKTSN